MSISVNKCLLFALHLVFLNAASFVVNASPWIEVGDERLRNNLIFLNDSGAMTISLTTWPVMWADVDVALKNVDRFSLNSAQKGSVRELEFEMRRQTRQGLKHSVEFIAASSRALFRSFSSFNREKGEVHNTFDWDGESFAIKLRSNLTTDPDDSLEKQFDGSYVAGVLGEWLLGVGAVDRWWGAGSQSNLILTNNARPVPAFMLRTKRSQHFETPLLSWLGEWQFIAFLGQMESARTIPDAKLTGMRFTFKPIDNLEFGLSRAMQWGGEGRDNDLKTFWKSITTKDENTVDQAGNQLGGVDIRYNFSFSSVINGAIYAQTIGEDEAGYLPSRRMYQFGFKSAINTVKSDVIHFFSEYTNTITDSFGDKRFNSSYEHDLYKAGYRFYGRSLGATYDNDSRVISVGGAYQQVNGKLSNLTISYMKLNEDGVARGNTVSTSDKSLFFVMVSHQQLFVGGQLKFGVSYQSEELSNLNESVGQTSVITSWEYRFE